MLQARIQRLCWRAKHEKRHSHGLQRCRSVLCTRLQLPPAKETTAVGFYSQDRVMVAVITLPSVPMHSGIPSKFGNTAVGAEAMISANQDSTTAVGYRALAFNTGFENSAFGFRALEVNTGASWSTAIGYRSIASNQEAWSSSTAVGSATLELGTTGAGNTAVGAWALRHNRANANTAIGMYSQSRLKQGPITQA